MSAFSGYNQVDYPLDIIQSREDYSKIALKSLYSFPEAIFYDSGWPLGTIYPWPIPQAGLYEIHILTKEVLGNISDPTVALTLPPEYFAAIEYNLAVRLCPAFGKAPRADLIGLAKDSLNVIRQANTQMGVLQMPAELLRSGIYNPYSDQSH